MTTITLKRYLAVDDYLSRADPREANKYENDSLLIDKIRKSTDERIVIDFSRTREILGDSAYLTGFVTEAYAACRGKELIVEGLEKKFYDRLKMQIGTLPISFRIR